MNRSVRLGLSYHYLSGGLDRGRYCGECGILKGIWENRLRKYVEGDVIHCFAVVFSRTLTFCNQRSATSSSDSY